MIKRLRKNLTVLLSALFGLVFIGGLAMFHWGAYEDRVTELRRQVRLEISEVGIREIEKTRGEALEMENVDYSLFHVKKDGTLECYGNHLPEIEEQKQYAYAQKVAEHWKEPVGLWKVTYITKQRKAGRYVVLISVYPAVKASMPTLIVSLLMAGVGIILLILLTKLFSKRLVQPVEQMIVNEKKFMSNASHELKTPLTVIRANAQMLETEVGNNRHLQYIQQETEHMIVMVNKMLTLMRLDTPVEQTVHRGFCVDEALLEVIYPMESVAFEKKLTMEIDIKEKMHIVGDEEQIKKLISILLDNAICYTPEGGNIRVCAYFRSRRFTLSVSNTGEPISKEQQEKLFGRFYRGDEARTSDGSHFGLGLSIARSIVANHHGKIWVESQDGCNIFLVVLPVGR